MYRKIFISLSLILFVLLSSCAKEKKTEFKIDYEKYTLKNGLEVVLHTDKSDPIAAVAIMFHVGSNREVPGKTGFAHLFEHMMFQESQHVAQDQFFRIIQGSGGTLNGGTWEDGTVYYEVVPKNALEKVLWLESDRMGFLLPTVTQQAFQNQQDVVMNEKRQRVDNRPYGSTDYIIGKLLYPKGHPYNWQVIGSMEDLQRASLEDVHNFFKKWYGPNNATLVIAGDIDIAQTKKLVEKYFGEIKPIPEVQKPKPQAVELNETKRVFYEDNFAKSPELTMVYPTVEQFHKDSYALEFLSQLLTDGKKAPLYKIIVENKKLAPSIHSRQSSGEIAGTFTFKVRAFPSTNLTDVEKAIFEGLSLFEKEKFTQKDLDRIKTKIETDFYNALSSVLSKSFQLAQYNEYGGSPDFLTKDLNLTLAVTMDDIWNVYNKYIKGKHFVETSFVPKGQKNLAVKGAIAYEIPQDKIIKREKPKKEVVAEKIKSSFDRSIEPPLGPDPLLNVPQVWTDNYDNGIKVYGIKQNELPLVNFSIVMKGGMLLDSPDKIGVANLITDELMQGTKNKTPIELEEAIDDLGANIGMYTSKQSIVVNVNCLESKIDEVTELVKEILLEPRWDEKEFERVKQKTIEQIKRGKFMPSTIAGNVYAKLVYGKENILSNNTLGSVESVQNITINDLKDFYNKNLTPKLTYISIAGDISKEDTRKAFSGLVNSWKSKDVTIPEPQIKKTTDKAKVYFVDVPGSRQSEIRIGYLALAYTDPDYYPAYVMNYKLGGAFNGILNMVLREEKGYTYGARSGFSGSKYPGPFTASAAVQSIHTLESVEIFRDLMSKYADSITEQDLQFTKNALIKSNSRRFETLSALIGMLNNIARFNLPFDYVKEQEKIIREMTVEKEKQLAKKYIQPNKMNYLIVGDAKTQLKPLKKLGFGNPILIDTDGNPVK